MGANQSAESYNEHDVEDIESVNSPQAKKAKLSPVYIHTLDIESKIQIGDNAISKDEYDDQLSALNNRSITPRTFNGVDVAKPSLIYRSDGNRDIIYDYNKPYYSVEKYQSNGTNVLYFGINTVSGAVQDAVKLHNTSNVKSTGFSADKSIIEEIESTNISNAIELLKHTNKTVVSFFVKNNDSTIKVVDNVPEIHTVMLYKQEDESILAIDPTNSNFDRSIFDKYTKKDIEISTLDSKDFQIYRRYEDSKPGPESDDWRDNIDIAVKLAMSFVLNKESVDVKGTSIDLKSLKETKSVKEISNLAEVYLSLPGELLVFPAKAKQSSDIEERKEATYFLKKLAHSFNQLTSQLNNTGVDPYHLAEEMLNKKGLTIMDSKKSHSAYIASIKELANEFVNTSNLIASNPGAIDQLEMQLVGEHFNETENDYYE